ncbi:MAG TPA: aldo/keto reductase, partial [Acidimicrobiia bacterium]
AGAHGATPAQVSLAWLISRPNVVAIPGASSIEQLKRNVEAADLDLTADELAELTAVSDAFEPLAPPQTALALVRARRGAA